MYLQNYTDKDTGEFYSHPIGAFYGYESDGFYEASDFNEDGSLKDGIPYSTLNDVQAGDVKYVDQNGDGKIDSYDKKYFDYNSTPDFVFGLQLGLKWKNFGMEASFNGALGAWTSLTLSSIYQPLYNNDKNISQYAWENCWRADGSNPNPKYPRLTTLSNNNNYASSDLWWSRRDYFKLRNLMVWYDFKDFRLFLRGGNLFSIDTINILDPEDISMGYPSMRNFQVGLKYRF